MQDRVGSVVLSWAVGGAPAVERRYGAYGEEKAMPGGSVTLSGAMKYATYYRDVETALDYADQRYYAWNNHRFVTPDP